jgi:hypothetical protein
MVDKFSMVKKIVVNFTCHGDAEAIFKSAGFTLLKYLSFVEDPRDVYVQCAESLKYVQPAHLEQFETLGTNRHPLIVPGWGDDDISAVFDSFGAVARNIGLAKEEWHCHGSVHEAGPCFIHLTS